MTGSISSSPVEASAYAMLAMIDLPQLASAKLNQRNLLSSREFTLPRELCSAAVTGTASPNRAVNRHFLPLASGRFCRFIAAVRHLPSLTG